MAACSAPGATRATAPTAPPSTTGSTTTTTTTSTTTPPAATTTTVPAGPPYQVETTTLPLVDTSRPTVSHGRQISPTRALTTVVWVPAAPGRRPLVVFGSGYDVGPGTYAALLQSWAAHGYVVAAPEFPLSDPAVAGADLDEADINNQPGDLRFVADWLIGPASPLRSRIDPTRVAVAGHSDGGEAAVAAGENPTPPGEPPWRALVAMSAQTVPGHDGPYPPILVTQGDADTINPPSLGLGLYDSAGPPKYLLILRGGGHLPPVEAGSQWLPGVEAVTEAFLDAYVAGDQPPSAVTGAAVGHPLMTLSDQT